ncbi:MULTISPECIES: L,D-transpeptidase [Bacillaceae]|uniref:L,D-transpeptidase n=1 Tax=Bacillus mesophilum TaxID=1071718 RepID=A0A7V7UW43_9BACI|nr:MULTISPECIES: L,D-transpeptidase [Bacillaceae]KAB2333791.1 L,D-transpeptidase [Bacillus mesophilum]
MMKFLTSLLLLGVISPLWPLGQNPLPGDPFVIVNKETNEAAYINENKVQTVYRAATGKTEELTPEGLFTITVKASDPYYRKKDIPGGDPNNPLGTRWIGFDAENSDGRTYGIHGTNNPSSIGTYASLGCIRLQNEHVEALYDVVPIGTKVLVLSTDLSFEDIAKEYGAIE